MSASGPSGPLVVFILMMGYLYLFLPHRVTNENILS